MGEEDAEPLTFINNLASPAVVWRELRPVCCAFLPAGVFLDVIINLASHFYQ